MASKYQRLTDYLISRSEVVVDLDFDQLDFIVADLPESARRHPAWWANSKVAHDHARGWLDANRVATPRFTQGFVRFTMAEQVHQVKGTAPIRVEVKHQVVPIRTGPANSTALSVEVVNGRSNADVKSRRIGLVGCVKNKAQHPLPAKSLYVSPLFRGRRSFVEHSCTEWWILSALHGLIEPNDPIVPYDMSLKDMSTSDRRQWSSKVLRQIIERIQPNQDDTVELHAGADYRAWGLEEGLRAMGCAIEIPTLGLRQGEQLSFYARTKWN